VATLRTASRGLFQEEIPPYLRTTQTIRRKQRCVRNLRQTSFSSSTWADFSAAVHRVLIAASLLSVT
jgi:hypothetical protein